MCACDCSCHILCLCALTLGRKLFLKSPGWQNRNGGAQLKVCASAPGTTPAAGRRPTVPSASKRRTMPPPAGGRHRGSSPCRRHRRRRSRRRSAGGGRAARTRRRRRAAWPPTPATRLRCESAPTSGCEHGVVRCPRSAARICRVQYPLECAKSEYNTKHSASNSASSPTRRSRRS